MSEYPDEHALSVVDESPQAAGLEAIHCIEEALLAKTGSGQLRESCVGLEIDSGISPNDGDVTVTVHLHLPQTRSDS